MKIKKFSGPITVDRDEWFHILEFTGLFETAEGQCNMGKV